MSAPNSAGGRRRVKAIKSVATTTSVWLENEKYSINQLIVIKVQRAITYSVFVCLLRDISIILYTSTRIRVLNKNARNFSACQIALIDRSDDHFQSQWTGPCSNHFQRLWMNAIRNIQLLALIVTGAQCHCFGSCCSFVQQRCVCHIQTSNFRNHCLVVQQRFQTTLSNFWLIWGVLCRPEIAKKSGFNSKFMRSFQWFKSRNNIYHPGFSKMLRMIVCGT